MRNTIACCYLTHNHPDVVKAILDRSLQDYHEHGIDILVCDDSDDSRTKEIVEERIKTGAQNLHYVDFHMARNGDDKLLRILMGCGIPGEYDYLWPCKDRVCFSGVVLDRLCEALEDDPDVIQIVNEIQRMDVSQPCTKSVYEDPAEFYRYYNMFTTNWEGTIRRKDTMLSPVDWEAYGKRYDLSEECFAQSVTLFARLAELTACRIRIVRFRWEEWYMPNGAGRSGWESDPFGIWIDRWIRANLKLPTLYDPYKAEGIRSITMTGALFGSVESMMEFHQAGKYNIEIFEKYREIWSVVTNLPLEWLKLLALDDYDTLLCLVVDAFESAIERQDFLFAYQLIDTNLWFNQIYDSKTYQTLLASFARYGEEMLSTGESCVFEGIRSVRDICDRYMLRDTVADQ